MIKLRDILAESAQAIINEGTRWMVGVEGRNGRISATYGHYDGYPEHTGKLLKKFYNNPGKAQQLLKLGKAGISFLDKSMKGGKGHSFNNPTDGETIFYGRDRGEKGSMMSKYRDRNSVRFNSGEEYAYIYSLKDKKWYYKSEYDDEFQEL